MAKTKKAKRQNLSCLEDLPNELVTRTFSCLNMKDLISCGQVSKRFRAIVNDEQGRRKEDLLLCRSPMLWESGTFLRKNALVDHLWMLIRLNQLPTNCKDYLGFVKITNGVAVKSKWMRKTLKLTMENVFFGKSIVHLSMMDGMMDVWENIVSRTFLII